MLNDIKPPPLDTDAGPHPGHRPHPGQPIPGPVPPVDERVDSPTHAATHLKPNVDVDEPGRHHGRYLGERGATDAVYEMPMEDRGSNFSIGLSITVMAIFISLLLVVLFSVFR